ncbi:hypothetical protein ACVBEG_27515 [Pseudomonas sp. GG8]
MREQSRQFADLPCSATVLLLGMVSTPGTATASEWWRQMPDARAIQFIDDG